MADTILPVNARVNIDGHGDGVITKRVSSTVGELYTVLISGTDFEVDLPSERLTLIGEQSGSFEHTTQMDESKSETESTRFSDVTENDVDTIITNQRNQATASKTHYDLKILQEFFKSINESHEIHDIPPPELCNILCKFFVSVRKSDGSNYEPVSLRAFLGSFERHLREKNYGYSIIHGIEFSKVKQVLQAKQKELKSMGHGNRPRRAEPISDTEIEQLWATNQLGSTTPESIINSLWFFNTVNFGLRGSDEHRDMCWGDITLCMDESGREYLEFCERQTKTRQGGNPRDVRSVKPKMWANETEPEKCPINIYKLYVSNRPSDYCDVQHPFYIATHTKQSKMNPVTDQWFKRQPIGQNKLTSIMKRMASAAGLSESKRLTNHSARKHLVQKLSENNVPANQIMQITGHRNIQSVNSYSSINDNQHRNISNILTNSTSTHMTQLNQQFNSTNNTANLAAKSANYSFFGSFNNLFAGNISGGTFNINITPSVNNSIQSQNEIAQPKRPRLDTM